MSSVKVVINGQTNNVTAAGFQAAPALRAASDVGFANCQLSLSAIHESHFGRPIGSGDYDGTLWPTNMTFAITADPLRMSPAIHVNQEGYLPAYPKKAIVGYYVGSLGELPILTNSFLLVNAQSGATVFQGTLTQRSDVGYTYSPTPYQTVYQADFSSFTTPGSYRLVVPGMGRVVAVSD